MGGTGGRGYFRGESSIDDLRRRAASAMSSAQVQAQVNQFLQSLLGEINARDAEQIREYLDEIEDALADRIESIDTLLFGGSVAKHTYVDGLSDIDALVVLREEPDETPVALRERLFDALRHALLRGAVRGIQQGQLAVTIRYEDDIELQLVPAVRGQDDKLKISDPSGSDWSQIAPRRFVRQLTRVNQNNSGIVVPTIKLAKSLLSSLPKERQLSGYHVEALAVQAFEDTLTARDLRGALLQFFQFARDRISRPMKDVTGQSTYLDAYLGGEGSLERRITQDSLDRIARRLENARSLEQWRDLFEVP